MSKFPHYALFFIKPAFLASGKVKPATAEDYAREIALLKQKIKDGLD